jgi:uncharacterized protein (UPF0261 family)
MSGKYLAVLGTLDTKGPEYEYLIARLRGLGLKTLMLDISCKEGTAWPADCSCHEVAAAAGQDFTAVAPLNKIEAGKVMVQGATSLLRQLESQGALGGIMAMGGANGTLLACEVMKAFPIGLPKLVVSVMAAGDPRANAGTKDILLINSVMDLCLNRVTQKIIDNAAAAMAGMFTTVLPAAIFVQKKLVAASMMGLTQTCALGAKQQLEGAGFEVMVFHTNGIGGRALEEQVLETETCAVLDVTINEIGNYLLGGVFDAGPQRLEAAGEKGIPVVVVPGAVDFVNFWGKNIPAQYTRGRSFIYHNAQNTLMRTSPEENFKIGQVVATKLRCAAESTVVVPLKGFSGNDRSGGPCGVDFNGNAGEPWYNQATTEAFVAGLKQGVQSTRTKVVEVDAHINDREFYTTLANVFQRVAGVKPEGLLSIGAKAGG